MERKREPEGLSDGIVLLVINLLALAGITALYDAEYALWLAAFAATPLLLDAVAHALRQRQTPAQTRSVHRLPRVNTP